MLQRRRVTVTLSPFATVSAALRTLAFDNHRFAISDKLVPEGASASKFHSSNNPKLRRRNIKSYMLAPQSTERLTAVTIGITHRPWSQFQQIRAGLPQAIADCLGIDAEHVSLGATKRMKRGTNAWDETKLPNVTAIDPVPYFFVPIHVDETVYDLEDVAMFGNEIYLTVLEGSFEGLRRLSVCYAEPPRGEMESVPEMVLGDEVTPADIDAVEGEWMDKLSASVAMEERAAPATAATAER
jgi:hypothetical protein